MGDPRSRRAGVLMGRRFADSVLRKIAEQHPEQAHLVGAGHLVKKTEDPKPAKAKKLKPRVGTIIFDSQGEADAFLRLSEKYPLVVAHGCIALSHKKHIEPDFLVITQINNDGTFMGFFADYKSIWAGKEAPHIEPDFRAKMDWLEEQFSIIIKIFTQQGWWNK
jgi:hypothetical protein